MIYRKYDRLRTSGRSRLSPFSAVSGYTRITDGNEDWRSQYGANGAAAAPRMPRTTSANRANPLRFLEGKGWLSHSA